MRDSDRLIRLRRSSQPASTPMVFERVAIVGLDGPGAAIARATRRTWPSSLVIAVDRADVIEQAVRQAAIDVGSRDLTLVSGADLVVLASTPEANLNVIPRLGGIVTGSAVVTDLGDRPRLTLEAARHLPTRVALVTGCLLADTEPPALEAADVDWLSRCVWLLVETTRAPSALDRLSRFASGLGARPQVVSEAEFARRVAPTAAERSPARHVVRRRNPGGGG